MSSSPPSSTLPSPGRIALRSTSALSRDRYSQVSERAVEEERRKGEEKERGERKAQADNERRERERHDRDRAPAAPTDRHPPPPRPPSDGQSTANPRRDGPWSDRDRRRDDRRGDRHERHDRTDRDRDGAAHRGDRGGDERRERPERDERRERGGRDDREQWDRSDRSNASQRSNGPSSAASSSSASAASILRITPSSLSSSPPSSSSSSPLSSVVPHPIPAPLTSAGPHPLAHAWVLYYDHRSAKPKAASTVSYESSLLPVSTVSSVEGFWAVWNHVLLPSALEPNSNYHLFRLGVRPVWEDARNEKGGQWVVKWPSKDRERVDGIWLRAVLGVIGETLGAEDDNTADAAKLAADVTGVVVSRRRNGDRIAVWNASRDEQRIRRLGERIRRLVQHREGGHGGGAGAVTMAFDLWEDALSAGSSYGHQPRYTL